MNPQVDIIQRLPLPVIQLADAIANAGGTPVLVGGAIRDSLLGLVPKDFDIEAYGLPPGELVHALEKVGRVHAVGKSFGVLKVKLGHLEIDVSLPRKERKVGLGHRGFAVDYDPAMPFAEAASRRDFTINAIGCDLRENLLLDPWQGASDLRAGVIRHVSPAFGEDPLRVLRACQFAARFGFLIAPETLQQCRSLAAELPTLSAERVWEEFKKLLLKSTRPSLGIQALDSTGALSLFPELASLQGVRHNHHAHPEGDVWAHNNLVLDACKQICLEDGLSEGESLVLLLAALCHDLGKPATAVCVDGAWHNPGHELAGVYPAQTLLARIGCPKTMMQGIVDLVREHGQVRALWKQSLIQPVPDGAIRRLALRVPLLSLTRLALADFRGRAAADAAGPCAAVDWLRHRAAALQVLHTAPKPILQGRHLQSLGLPSGPAMGGLLKAAFEAQLDGDIADLPAAVAWVKARLH